MTRRRGIIAIVVAVVVLGGAVGTVYLKGGSTTVSVDEAVGRFRKPSEKEAKAHTGRAETTANESDEPQRTETTAPAAAPTTETPAQSSRPLPAQGVYVYNTTGHDEVDVFGGNRHDYPSETTITVKHAGCGVTERWDALEERWDERESCPTPEGDRLRRFTSHHEFFQHADSRTLRCDGFTFPEGAAPGDTWQSTCNNDTTKSVTTLRAVGYETVDVDGQPVEALHVRADTKLSGEQNGESHRDVWGSRQHGIVLRERAMVDSRSVQPVLGEVRYQESYEIKLRSLEPRT